MRCLFCIFIVLEYSVSDRMIDRSYYVGLAGTDRSGRNDLLLLLKERWWPLVVELSLRMAITSSGPHHAN